MEASTPVNERRRLEALRSFNILDTLPEPAYNDIAKIASLIAETPIALMSLVDDKRQWFKARVGLDVQETARELAFCAHAILEPDKLLVVQDASRDERFADNPLVTSEPSIRFYAGAPLITREGDALGTLCVIDRKPRRLSEEQKEALHGLSRQVMAQLELRRVIDKMELLAEEQRKYEKRMEAYQVKLERINTRLTTESETDELTGLVNRRAFERRLEEEFENARRYERPLSLLMIDVDRFKAFNDDFGHPAGDDALREVATCLAETSRIPDVVARFGGEEFAMILPSTGGDGATVLAERVRAAIAGRVWKHRQLSVSIGVAALTAGTTNRSALLADADRALYSAKRNGRDQVKRAA